jgi:lysozyme
MQISKEGLALIKKFEGFESRAYLCPAGVWTIGYGHTKDVKEGDEWSQAHAEHMLEVELEEFCEYVNKMVKVPLEQYQFDALVAWVYNLGAGNFKESTLLRVLNQGDYDDVPHQIKRWNKAGGRVLQGLVRRREAEALLFQNKEWEHV